MMLTKWEALLRKRACIVRRALFQMGTKCQRADFGVYFQTWGDFQEILLHERKKWSSALLAPPVWFVGRQAGCLHILAVHNRRDHRKMVRWPDRCLGRGSPQSQVSPRRQWTTTLIPEQCKDSRVWKSENQNYCMGKELTMESTAWPWGWPLWSGWKAWRPGEAAYSPWSSLCHLQNPWHLLGEPEQKEKGWRPQIHPLPGHVERNQESKV